MSFIDWMRWEEAVYRILGHVPHPNICTPADLHRMIDSGQTPVEAAAAIAVAEVFDSLTFDEAESLGLDGTGRDQ